MIALLFVGNNYAHAQSKKIDSLKTALEIAGSDTDRLRLNNELSSEYSNIDFKQSFEYGNKALELARKTKNQLEEIKALYAMGDLVYETDMRDSAIEYFQKSEALAKSLDLKELRADNLMRIAKVYRYQTDHDSTNTVNNLLKSVEVSKKANYVFGVARSYAKLASVYTRYNEIATCEEYLEKSAEYYLKIPQGNVEIAHYYNEVGDKIWDFNPTKSMDFYLKGLEYSENHPHISVNLAKAYKLTGEPIVALKYLETAIPLLKEEGNLRKLGIAMGQLTEVHIELNNFESANKVCDEAIALLDHLGRSTQVALPQIYRAKGLILKNYGNDQAALEYFKKGKQIANRIKNKYERVKTGIALGNYYATIDPQKASEYCEEALKSAKRYNNKPNLEIEACDCLYKIHKENNSSNQALLYYEQKMGLSDSLSTLKLKHALEINTKMSEKNTELREQEIKRDVQSKQVNTLLISTLVGLLLIGFLSFTLNRIRKQNDEITKKTSELEDANMNLDGSNKELERFAHIASHDLKSPLRSIISFSGLLRRAIEKGDATSAHDYLNFIESNGKRMNRLIEDILKYSKISQPKMEGNELEDINLNELVNEISQLLKQSPNGITTNIESINLPTVKWNYSKLFLLFQNLIENGLKYNESERPNVKLYFSNSEGVNAIYIEDNGIGFKEEYYDTIFEMFQRLHNQEEYEGTGLGLANSKKIVTEFGGEISVTSKVGEGSIFKIKLPQSMIVKSVEPAKAELQLN